MGSYCLTVTMFLLGMTKKVWKYIVYIITVQHYECNCTAELYIKMDKIANFMLYMCVYICIRTSFF